MGRWLNLWLDLRFFKTHSGLVYLAFIPWVLMGDMSTKLIAFVFQLALLLHYWAGQPTVRLPWEKSRHDD